MTQHSMFAIQTVAPKIRKVTFSNPPVNVVGADTVVQLLDVLDELSQDERVQAVIFDSGTPEYFFNHADLQQVPELLPLTGADGTPTWVDLVTRLTSAPFISIASIRGRTRGGGDEITLAFDLRYASREKALFCRPEVAIGIVPGGGGSDRLARLLGRDRALEAILTSQDCDAEHAEQYGWVTKAVPDAELDDLVNATAARIASFDKPAVLGAKAQINRSTLPPVADLRASWAEFAESVTWPGFQARVPQLGKAIAEIGLDEIERNLGHYAGLINQQAQPPHAAAQAGLTEWHHIVEQSDWDRLPDLLGPDVIFRDPATHEPHHGKAETTTILRTVFGVLEDFTPLRHLGRATGYYSAVRTRVQRLMASGVLQIAAVTDPLALGLPVMALLGIKVDRSLREITDALGDIGSVIHLVATAGSFDLFAEVVCRAMDEQSAVINDRIRTISGVREVESFPYFGIHVHRFTWDAPPCSHF